MSDAVLNFLGMGDAPTGDDPFAGADSAATTEATAEPGTPTDEPLTLDEAFAALDGQVAPQTEPTPPETAETATQPALTPEDIAALVAENERFKAEKAQVEEAAKDAQFEDTWDAHLEAGYAFYDSEKEKIRALGIRQGRSEDEIDLAIYRRVEMGIGLIDPATGAPALGEREWERQSLMNRAMATREYLASKSAPSALDEFTIKYGLDTDDRTALAKFVSLPREQLEELARTLGAKNQRLNTQQIAVKQTAAANVANRLSNGVAPGSGSSAPRRSIASAFTGKAENRQREAELLGRVLNLV